MTLKRIGLTGSVNRQARITGRRITLNRVSLRRFPFPVASVVPGPNIEEVFSTWLYSGTSSTQTITNGIDLSTKGGLVWLKSRSGLTHHVLNDTVNGVNNFLYSSATNALITNTWGVSSFSNTGFQVSGSDSYNNASGSNYAAWTFRKQQKFFDIVTYTGNGQNSTPISHNLGSIPGCIIIKCKSNATDWIVWHRSMPESYYLRLNSNASAGTSTRVNNVTSTSFNLSNDADVNGDTRTYVAYVFAHNAGGFGTSNSDNVISCGFYDGNGSSTGPEVNLGFEPQWILVKRLFAGTNAWYIIDNMRGMTNTNGSLELYPNDTNGELGFVTNIAPTTTGFQVFATSAGLNDASDRYIYIAIRRGPMKTPTTGTSVFNTILRDGTSSTQISYTGLGFSPDAIWGKVRGNSLGRPILSNRTTGRYYGLYTDLTNAESDVGSYNSFDIDGFTSGPGSALNSGPVSSGYYYVHHCFKRAPGFFDYVFYKGTGSATTFNHNLTVVPELMIVKRRDSASDGYVYSSALGNTKSLSLFAGGGGSDAAATVSVWNNTTPTSTVFSVQTQPGVNASGGTYIAYLFATLTGVSKVGSYTGTGTTLQVNCGFTSGARYVLIKRTDSTGDWYVWDSARGIIAGNDPYVLVNVLATEVTNTDYIDPYSLGFEISSTAPAAINASGGTYIFLAIA